MGREWSRDQYHRQPISWQREGFPGEQPQDDSRYSEPHDVRRPPMGIDKALREDCNIPVKAYFVAAILDDGNPATFSGPGTLSLSQISQFFDMETFRTFSQQAATGAAYDDSDYGVDSNFRSGFGREFSSRRMNERRRSSALDAMDNELTYKTRKRPRSHSSRQLLNEDRDVPVSISATKKPIRIGESDVVWNFYQQRFKNCQQTACKLIAKAWVKAVEPKKQSHHPYTGKDEKAPEWWPKPWGPMKDERVRHKEPDHLYKKERVHLLAHILRLIVEPSHKQHPDVQKSCLNVKKLEEVTAEALSSFFSDPETPGNCKKRPYLNEIFKVARFEERYKNGEIDGDMEVFVMADDKIPEYYQTESENSLKATREKHDEHEAPIAHRGLTPSKAAVSSHPMMSTSGASGTNTTNSITAPQFLSELPVRGGSHLSAQLVQSDMGSEQQASYVEGATISGVTNPSIHHSAASLPMSEILASPHDTTDRRHSLVFNSSTDFSAQGNTAIYPQQWQPASTAPATSPMYSSFQHQQTPTAQPNYSAQTNLGLQQGQQPYLPPQYDGLPRTPSFDPHQGHLFRSNPVAPPNVGHSQGYPNYLSSDNRGLPGSNIKVESLSRPHLQ
ncbi:hypothetical protein jhhlp_002090 [Lomentospora prolificans]|uniref:Subtelomeric hrmA-associated cluster protein AFUB-079030/YDR124W-like helical bundle domain-containing protein n=1 Tax=Lomentospora prolificans TaxID=41688 RepID=A0A2N3ND33_9PEZI|nr:hypothetical protein jhhlp_002090 [Lomentospora prolificans]